MRQENDIGVISHLSVGTNDITRSRLFYDKVMTELHCEEIFSYESGVAYGKHGIPSFWVQVPISGTSATTGNGSHVGFSASSSTMVDRFYQAGIDNGGGCDGPPGYRKHYNKAYYAAYLKDPDDNKIEALFWNKDAK